MAALNPMNVDAVSHIWRVGYRARAPRFAATLVAARYRSIRQARQLLKQVEAAMAASRIHAGRGFSPGSRRNPSDRAVVHGDHHSEGTWV